MYITCFFAIIISKFCHVGLIRNNVQTITLFVYNSYKEEKRIRLGCVNYAIKIKLFTNIIIVINNMNITETIQVKYFNRGYKIRPVRIFQKSA